MNSVKRIPKTDIHAHATPFKAYFPPHYQSEVMISAEELLEMYDRLGIGRGILLPIHAPEAQPSILSSEGCKFLADKYPDRFMRPDLERHGRTVTKTVEKIEGFLDLIVM